MLVGAGAALVVGLVTIVLLTSRGTPESVAAAPNAASTPAPAAAVPPPAVDGVKWSGANVVHWTGKARNSAAFELPAENTVAIWMRDVRPLLVVRCMAKSAEAFVITDSALKMEPQTDDHTVTYSFDDQPETKEHWHDAADHNAVFAPDAAAFTQRLMHARTLRVGYTPHNAAPVVAVFHVNGLGPLLEPSAKHCGW
jgi:Type VI secretion system VasI, EvfG, VC_A0118